MDYLERHLEALLFVAERPLKTKELQSALQEMFDTDIPEGDIAQGLAALVARYQGEEYAFALEHSGGGYHFLTKPAYQASIRILLKQQSKRRLSTSALETLAIIAYKQPVTKGQMEQIRGVNCDYAVNKLLDKGVIEMKGKAESLGRPILYGTTDKLLDYLGINDLSELPTLKDLAEEDVQAALQQGDKPTVASSSSDSSDSSDESSADD